MPPALVMQAAARHRGRAARRSGDPSGDRPQGRTPIGDLRGLLAYLDASFRASRPSRRRFALAYAVATRARTSGTRHVDVIVNPTHWPTWQHNLGGMIDTLDAGFSAAELDGGATAALCVSLARNQTRGEALELVERMRRDGAPEGGGVVDRRRRVGRVTHCPFRRPSGRPAPPDDHCAHAGESSGPVGVHEAIDLLGAERIGHGIRSIEDRDLVPDLARGGVPLDS